MNTTSDSPYAGITKAEVVRWVYRWRRTGWKTASIVRELNQRGILSAGYWGSKGEDGKAVWNPPGLWTRQTVLQMLRNSTYCGQHMRMGLIVPCDPIISRELFDEVQRVTAEIEGADHGAPATTPPSVHALPVGQIRPPHVRGWEQRLEEPNHRGDPSLPELRLPPCRAAH